MLKFRSKTLIDMYGDSFEQYDIAFIHYALKVRYNSIEEYNLLETDFDNLKKVVNDNQFKIYFYDINSFKEIMDNTNIVNKYHNYIYVRINNKEELQELSKLIGHIKVNAIIDYELFNGFSASNINLILNIDKISTLSSKKLLELSKKYNLNNVCLGQTICFDKNYTYDLIDEYSFYKDIKLSDNDYKNRDMFLKLFLSNDIYSIEEYKNIEEKLYKLIDDNEDIYQRYYNIFKNIITKAKYNFKGLEEEFNENQNLIGILFKNEGVCEGFSKTLYQACNLANIECIIVDGGPKKKTDGGHMWNQVCINGIWYNADCAAAANFYKDKGIIGIYLESDKNILYKANSILCNECNYCYDIFSKNITTDMFYNDNYIIKYNECDKDYIDDLVNYINKEYNNILEFFGIEKLKKKLIISIYDDINKYKEYRGDNINDTSVGNMDVSDNNYYINVLSYKEYIKIKGNENKNVVDYYRLIIYELIHVVHEDYGTLHKSLIWIREGLAIYKSHQNDGVKKRLNKCKLVDLLEDNRCYYINYYVLIDYAFNKYEEDYIKNLISNPDIQIEETKKIFNGYLSENKLEKYKAWFANYSFFGYNSFVIDAVDFLFKFINIIGPTFEDSMELSINKFSDCNKDEIINRVQNYFDKHKINYNVFGEIEDGNLILENKKKEENKYLGIRQDGVSNYDKDKNKVIAKVILTNTVFDSLVIVHELTHNRNQPIGNRNITSDLFTESISYANEFIFVEEFLNNEDKSNYFKGLEKMLYSYADNLYLIYKLIIVYKYQADIYEDNYIKVFNDNNYDEVINTFEKYISNGNSVFKDSYFILGFVLSIYMFMEYKKDSKFFSKIEKLNNSINNNSFNECLNIIDIKDLKDLVNKFKISVLEFKEYLDSLNNKKIIN